MKTGMQQNYIRTYHVTHTHDDHEQAVTSHRITPSSRSRVVDLLPEVLDETIFVRKIQECEQERYSLFDLLTAESIETSEIN
jgi:nicotinamidase-related amidase